MMAILPGKYRRTIVTVILLLTGCVSHPFSPAVGPSPGGASGIGDTRVAGRERGEEDRLLAQGRDLLSRGEAEAAIPVLERFLDADPEHSGRLEALYNLAVALRQVGEFQRAIECYRALLRLGDHPDDDRFVRNAAFELADLEASIGAWREASQTYAWITTYEGVDDLSRTEAAARLGITYYELGHKDLAVTTIEEALDRFARLQRQGLVVDPRLLAQAYFTLGEICFSYFEAISLRSSPSELEKMLDWKVKMLLAARDRYLEAADFEDPFWMTAALYRIGLAYDILYKEILDAPLPEGLSPEEARIYRRELRKAVGGIRDKAVNTYRQILQFATEHQIDNEWVERIRLRLSRLIP
ncbi:MAG: tetratricopeptide repeat protein [Deltaproteobacteria bacterium]|nr:MAG: tetratricopeptide repeat protein [Deltaproteobacteria bacterium]